MAARRSRTGCATCRKRKLKCDEARPVCGQCTKSRRECVPSEGVAFRHEQNAGLNSSPQDGDRSLGNFFKYRNMFNEEQMKNFVPIQFPLEWREVTDPWADEAEQILPRSASSPQAYQQQVASHSLEALSTAATENTPYQPPVTYADFNGLYPGAKGGYGPAGGVMQGPNHNTNINFLLNPSSTPSAMIDPNLDATDLEGIKELTEANQGEESGAKHGDGERKDEQTQQSVTNEEQVALLLRNFDETTA